MPAEKLAEHICWCVDHGLNFFDHADIYGGGRCEENFREAFRQTDSARSGHPPVQMRYPSGNVCFFKRIHPFVSRRDLQRLGTDYLDVLVLHRPDALMEPGEVAEAFDRLEQSGKVRYFGVSNHRPGQIELLKKAVSQPLGG